MALYDLSRPQGAGAKLARPVELVCFALVVAHATYLIAAYLQGIWIVAPDGGGVPSDFVNVWAAGRMVLDGYPASVYDWPAHKLVEEAAIGHHFDGYFGWHYPPTFLFVAAALALLPYAAAYAFWVFATFPAYLIAIRAIIGDRIGYLLAAAFPAILSNFIVGQNGFLTAGLIGGALVLLQRQPIWAGILLGLLTYKPHLGILFPIALIAGGCWRTFFTAAIVAVLMAGASWLAFGGDAWHAFFANIGHTSQAFLSEGWADFAKLQTAFGLTRALGGSEALAWSVQAAVAVLAAGAIAVLWRRPPPSPERGGMASIKDASQGGVKTRPKLTPTGRPAATDLPLSGGGSEKANSFELKAAALGAGAMLATPYLYTYDLVVLAVPLAFLFRLGHARGFLPYELAGIGFACLLILIFPFVKAPVGFAAVLVVAALIARRALAAEKLSQSRAA
jgi:arabinofuranan 3-O-arabinosyltransferase